MKHLTLLILFQILTFSLAVKGSEFQKIFRAPNTVYMGFLGDASVVSINYERIIVSGNRVFFTSRIGAGINTELRISLTGSDETPPVYMSIPHHFTMNLGKGLHYFEAGIGGSGLVSDQEARYLVYPIVGYRIHTRKHHGFSFRICIHPRSIPEFSDYIFIPVGLTVGMSF